MRDPKLPLTDEQVERLKPPKYRPTPEHLEKLAEGRRRALAEKRMQRMALPPEKKLKMAPAPLTMPTPAPPAVTPAEREHELARLEPRAIEVLEAQLNSPDERIAQNAAKMLLEHKWGKPTQRQEVQQEVTQIEYVTTAATQWQRTRKPG